MKNYFSYNIGTNDLPKDAIKISPSQLSKFFDHTPQWWREQIMGESPEFTGNTASELGNCVHAAAAMYHDTNEVNYGSIDTYLQSLLSNPDVDVAEISQQYPIMVETLLTFLSNNKATHSEQYIYYEIKPNIYVAGSIDWYNKDQARLLDFKTTQASNKFRLPNKFPRAYWFQQLTYAWLLQKNNLPVSRMTLLYITRSDINRYGKTGNKLKDYPSELFELNESITEESIELIDGVLNLVAESIIAWNEQPELRYLLAQDYRLKQKPKRKLLTEL